MGTPLIDVRPPAARPQRAAGVRAPASLPAGMALGERATALFRAFLDERGLHEWAILFNADTNFYDIDRYLAALGETDARWLALPGLIEGGTQPSAIVTEGRDDETGAFLPPGVLWLRKSHVALARWNIYSLDNGWTGLWMVAAPSPQRVIALRDRLVQLRRTHAQHVWQIITGDAWLDQHIPRDITLTFDGLILDPALRMRLSTEIGGFFHPQVAQLHAELQVPYRRGILLHGPPGNGKTSIIRVIGAVHADIPAIVVRPGGDFGDSEFGRLIDEWRQQAPAILVIEDLDWLLPRISVSTFLNRIDGLERNDAGMLMIATTNHPESLDPAINNRPGRFDVVLEVASPTYDLRLAYLERGILGESGRPAIKELASSTEGLSFAHLREIINLAGLLALRDNRSARSEEDLRAATQIVVEAHMAAARSFVPEPEASMALAELHKRRKGKK